MAKKVKYARFAEYRTRGRADALKVAKQARKRLGKGYYVRKGSSKYGFYQTWAVFKKKGKK